MFGLREQVNGDPIWIIVRIRDDKDLRRASNHINPDMAKDAALGLGDKGIAGPCDQIDGGNGLRPIGQSGNCLCAADAINLVHPRDMRRIDHQRVHFVSRSGHSHGQTFDAGHFGRNCIHQNGRWIRGQTARNIKTRSVHRTPTPAQSCAALIIPHHIFRALLGVIGFDPLCREVKRGLLIGRHRRDIGADLLWGEAKCIWREG